MTLLVELITTLRYRVPRWIRSLHVPDTVSSDWLRQHYYHERSE